MGANVLLEHPNKLTLEFVNLLPFGIIFGFLGVLGQLHIPTVHGSYNIIVTRSCFFGFNNIILENICKGVNILVFFIVPIQAL